MKRVVIKAKSGLPAKSPLAGKVALVAGATRGAGRGIAVMLGEAGATVYCTGRNSRAKPASEGPYVGRPETIEETAELVTARGGTGIAVRVDHLVEAEVEALVKRIRDEQGRLDILVNDISEGEHHEWKPFWALSVEKGLRMFRRAVHSHIITSRHAAALMIERRGGLIVEVTDGDFLGFHGAFFYDLVKTTVNRLAFAMANQLEKHGVAAIAVTPGFLRSEAMLEHFKVTEANWRDGAKKDKHFLASETPSFVGRAVAALAADPNLMSKTGGLFGSWTLSDEYGFTDIDGNRPHWGRHYEQAFGAKQGLTQTLPFDWTLTPIARVPATRVMRRTRATKKSDL